MKDEEMAEEYIEKNCKIWEEGELTVDEIVRLAFLAGLKSGRLQWHDLRKDKNDLPKRDKDFVVKVTIPVMTHPSYVFATYYFDNKKWFSFGEEIEVIAWCEIPTFDKE